MSLGVSFPTIKRNQSIFLVSSAKNWIALDFIAVFTAMLVARVIGEMIKGSFTWAQLLIDAVGFAIPLCIAYAFVWHRLNRVEKRILDPIGTDIFHQKQMELAKQNDRKEASSDEAKE